MSFEITMMNSQSKRHTALKMPFCKTKDYDDVFECDLDKEEIQYFKDNLELFTEKVIPKEGKVFELKSNSCKQHYELHN